MKKAVTMTLLVLLCCALSLAQALASNTSTTTAGIEYEDGGLIIIDPDDDLGTALAKMDISFGLEDVPIRRMTYTAVAPSPAVTGDFYGVVVSDARTVRNGWALTVSLGQFQHTTDTAKPSYDADITLKNTVQYSTSGAVQNVEDPIVIATDGTNVAVMDGDDTLGSGAFVAKWVNTDIEKYLGTNFSGIVEGVYEASLNWTLSEGTTP